MDAQKRTEGRLSGLWQALYRFVDLVFVSVLEAIFSVLNFKVCRWYVMCGGWKLDEMRVYVACTEEVWYWALLDWFWANVEGWICHYMRYIPLPRFVRNWKRAWDEDEPDKLYSLKEYWGGTLGELWHAFICDPIFQFICPHLDVRPIQFKMTVPEAREKFACHPKLFRWMEEHMEERKKDLEEEAAEEAKEKAENGNEQHK